MVDWANRTHWVRRHTAARYAVPIVAVAGTTILAASAFPEVTRRFPFFAYFPTTLLSAYFGGLGPGLVAVLFSELLLWAIWVVRVPEQQALYIAAFVVFSAVGAVVSWLMDDLHRSRERLHAALERERAENAVKDAFLASLSHELRTPLNVVMGRAHMLLGMVSDEPVRHCAEVIAKNAHAQLRMVEDLLDTQGILQDRFDLRCEQVRLDHVAHAAVEELQIDTQGTGLQFRSQLQDIEVWGDPVRLKQVFLNLLSNALKFTPPPGQVALTVKRQREDAIVEVKDSGIGIPGEFLPYVFERFWQADQSYTRDQPPGLGLGLAITKSIAEAHGGTVEVQSLGLGRGACFRVRLPIQSKRVGPISQNPAGYATAPRVSQ